ncbi:MAG: hypothetical protein H7306_07740 [Bacteriovorax sp.]|nr:hypothetical protein [Rhizobacter sp.]
MKRLWLHRHALALSLVLSFTLALPAHAQDDTGRASREREALRRAQSALKQSQEQQATLTREKSDIAAERDKLGNSAKRAESQLGASRATAARAGTELARVTAEIGTLRTQAEADKKAAQGRADDLSKRLDETTRTAAERTRTVASLTALLERSSKALAAAETANREMAAFGQQMIEQVRNRAPADNFLRSEPVLGFSQVQLENQAEALKDRLAALKLNAVPAEK